MDQGVKAITKFCALSRPPERPPHYLMQVRVELQTPLFLGGWWSYLTAGDMVSIFSHVIRPVFFRAHFAFSENLQMTIYFLCEYLLAVWK